jgi:periplasmic divalent cation tolerance protein
MSRDYGVMIGVTTLPNRAEAEALGAKLVNENLAACAQIGAQIVSFYRWRGHVNRDDEVRLTLKVAAGRWEACAERLRELHPYEVPEVVAWQADRVDAAYARWVSGEIP